MRLMTLSILGPLAILSYSTNAPADSPPKPNIIFILADDLGYGDVGCYGQTTIQTPRLDQLAAQGMRFTQFYSGASSCAPARCVLMTGFHTGHATVRQNTIPNTALRTEDITVAEVLKRAGYHTALVGKWGLGGDNPDGSPLNVHAAPQNKGFDQAYGYLDQTTAHYYYPEYLWRDGVKEYIPANAGGAKNVNSHDLFTNKALQVVSTAPEPFYLQLSYTVPHKYLYDCPLESIYSSKPWPDIEKHFASMITRMDRDIGTLVDAIDARGIGNNTLIIFSSDNGPQQKEGHLAEFFDSNGPLRGIKFSLYEGGIREPFIARWTGTVPAGITSDHIGAFEDFLPTAAELAGVKAPSGIDGISIVPTLTGQGTQRQHSHLYWEYSGDCAVRWGRYKAVKIGSSFSLYDLQTDLGEQNNIAAQNPTIVAQMEQFILSSHASGTVPVSSPILTLVGDTKGSGSDYMINIGPFTAGDEPITRTFQVRNDAGNYSFLMEGEVIADGINDSRFSVPEGNYAWLVDGSNSDTFSITFNPTTNDPIIGQYLTITGYRYGYGYEASNNPIRLTFGKLPAPGDIDRDGDVDQSDFGIFQECISGSSACYNSGCEDADLDQDNDVDLMDQAIFISCMGGANKPSPCETPGD